MSSRRFAVTGTVASAWELETIEFVFSQLPDQDPFHARALVELRDPATGSVHDIDILVLGDSALYLIALRDCPGSIEGDDLAWCWTSPQGQVRHLEHPLRALHARAHALAARLDTALRKRGSLRRGERLPPIQPLVLLGNAEPSDLRLNVPGRACVVQRNEIAAALRRHEFPGATAERRERVTAIRAHAIQAGLDTIGLRPRRGPIRIGAYVLGPALAEGRGYQDREAIHSEQPNVRRRARIYLVPDQTDQAARLALRREADRDHSLLWSVREHPAVLALHEYVGDAALGPVLMLDAFEGGVSLREFLERRPTLSFADRMAILEQIALALAHCHRRIVYHGSLGPDAVLVRQLAPDLPPEVRLYNFQAGRSLDVSPTAHRSRFASEPGGAYQAPELFSAADAIGADTDHFSLGALSYYLFTNQAPAQSGIELQQRLVRDGALDPRSVTDSVPDVVARAIVQATRLSRSARGSTAHGADLGAWIEGIKAGLCPTRAEDGFVPPLQARAGDRLRDDLEVVGVLGRGASACVLEVSRAGQRFALKVSLGPAQDQRLLNEARALQRVRHPRIVQLHESFVLGERQCLLISLAGTRTLQQAIDQQGSIDLDLALRYGSDLLSALEHIEAKNIAHRDIKPANLGEGSLGKQSKRLSLFDFSLVGADATQVDVGTEPYRDPYLPLRGQWDSAADRWSAAIVLHEMLTGVRPAWKPRGISPLAHDAILMIASERFEPAVRDRLTTFFATALARELPQRFASAKAMRSAWEELGSPPPSPRRPERLCETEEARRQVLAALPVDAPLDALPLGVRARNALDRAGLTRAIDLLSLPDNRLSAIRGAGSKVAREIDELRKLWLRERAAPNTPSFFPQYRGADLRIDLADLPTVAAQALADAGLDRLAAVASAPEEHLLTLARRHGFDLADIRAELQARHSSADTRERPTTSRSWIDALLPNAPLVRRWLGLDGAPVAPGAVSGAVHKELARARERTLQHPALAELTELVCGVVDDLGGIAPLWRAAEALRAGLGESTDDRDALARSSALVRWAAELSQHSLDASAPPRSLWIVRLGDDRPEAAAWVSRDHERSELVRRLGHAADGLAARDVLAAPSEAEVALHEIVRGTPLEQLPQSRLIDLAAQASSTAVCSSRLELYHRQLPADRAILHAAPALTGDLTPDEVHQRVRARYPEAAPLPCRPELDALLAPLGLLWTGDRYRRRGDEPRSSLNTHARLTTRRPTAHPHQLPAATHEAVHSREFEARLEFAIRGRETLLLAVSPRLADRAAAELSRVVRRPPCLLDRRLIAAIEALARTYEIDRAVLEETDRAGESSPEWPNLCRLAAEAADHVADELFPNREPLLLARPGLLARYRLSAFLHRAVQGTRDRDAASLLFLVPCHRSHMIEDILPVPGLAAAQRLHIPEPWLLNEGRRARTDHSSSSNT
ncbi:protein kinase domain-containing protein [Nannocystis pusilla]|uniref:non-specific serine/threonine protein kinase n=1 Tax=Nannocystis pusilla TaxID=889268 RepID=A0ABS7TPB1_9BACT|nr:protein kinase [Nannocystis pusilla]MBZ5710076.1 protein kinase [Nannocystis pusilla]